MNYPTRSYLIGSDIFPAGEGEMMLWMLIEQCPINGTYVISHHETREEAVEALEALFA